MGCLRRRLFITNQSFQIVSFFGRTCIPLAEIRELLYKVGARGHARYYIKTIDNIYDLGRVYNQHKRKILRRLANCTNLVWENTAKYFPDSDTY